MTDDLIEAVAEAVWNEVWNEIWGGASEIESPWELARDGDKEVARRMAQAALDAVTATHTIVELPPNVDEDEWTDEQDEWKVWITPVRNPRVMFRAERPQSVEEAREFASALLAAAVVAERTEGK